MIALALTFIIAGYVIRDGYPSFGPGMTFAARAAGGVLCAIGGFCLAFDAVGAALGLAIGIGFWTDHDHADGQGAQTWRDAGWLIVSGMTSLMPLALACAWLWWPWGAAVVLAGIVKVPIWFLCWRVVPEGKILQPTRVAAAILGLVVGIMAAILATLPHGALRGF